MRIKEVHSQPDAKRAWTAWFIAFDTGTEQFDAGTFDRKISDLANELSNTGERGKLVCKPGAKPNTLSIVSLERSEQPPPADNQDDGPPVGPDPDSVPDNAN